MAEDIDAYVTNLTRDDAFSGVVLAAFEGELVLVKGYGWANFEQRRENVPTTIFRISSLTKSFTAMAILLLQERGLLHVDQSVCSYLEPCPAAWRPVTIHHLLTHTSGIPDYVLTPGFWESTALRKVSAEELITLSADQPLTAVPGERFAYSNSGYLLLGYIVGRVANPALPADQAYARFLQQAIFAPLQMNSTGSALGPGAASACAQGYDAGQTPAARCEAAALFGMGDLVSTAPDLYRWGLALGRDTLAPYEVRELMFSPYASTSAYRTAYGYGWYISTLGDERRIWHSGATPGFRSYFQRSLDKETIIIVLSNSEAAPVVAMGHEIAAIMIRHAHDRLETADEG